MSNEQPTIRVRFAPSPTGYLHIGGLRTALYNELFARKHGGTLVLRIEDTDRSRYVEGAEQNLIATLAWAGITFDEGPEQGGKFGPYRQSERLALYTDFARQLIDCGGAYVCTCEGERSKGNVDYSKGPAEIRHEPNCVLVGGTKEFDALTAEGKKFVVRLRVPKNRDIIFTDIVRKKVKISSDVIDDQILMKSDGFPTYHLASVVDDHVMAITYVIRGEEWLSSTPKHILLYEYFGWAPPIFTHLPLLLNKDHSKLSKRQGDVAVESYRDKGYLAPALVNFVALLGWNPGDNREQFSHQELIDEFVLEKVHKSGAVVDYEKLKWINGQYVKKLSSDDFVTAVQPFVEKSAVDLHAVDSKTLERGIANIKDRVQVLSDAPQLLADLLLSPLDYPADVLIWKKSDRTKTQRALQLAIDYVAGLSSEPENLEQLEKEMRAVMEKEGMGAGDFFWPIRYALSGAKASPSVFELLVILGSAESKRRLTVALKKLQQ